MDLELAGKKAIVTGGSRGIGKQIARVLAQEGVDVAIAARDSERLAATAAEIVTETGRTIVPVTVDTSDDESVKTMVEKAAQALGGVDILINGAATVGGIAAPPKLAEVTADAFWADMNVKVMGYLRCAQAVAPYMIDKGWGRIVNFTGLFSIKGRIGGASVSAAKHGVWGMTKSLALEFGHSGITANVISPGLIAPDRETGEGQHSAETIAAIPLGFVGQPFHIGSLCGFLASEEGGYVTGQMIACNGGGST